MLKRQAVLILCITGFLVFSCVESKAEKQSEESAAISFDQFYSMLAKVVPPCIKIVEVKRESETVISIKVQSDDYDIIELLTSLCEFKYFRDSVAKVIKANLKKDKVNFHIECSLKNPKSVIGTCVVTKLIKDAQEQISTQKNHSIQETRTASLTLRRADGSIYKMEGEVKHYEDNKFVVALGSGGEMALSLEQLQKIEFLELPSKTVAFRDRLTLRNDGGSTNTFEGQVKCYEDNKFILVPNSGEEISFPAKRVQLIAFNVIAKKQIARTVFRESSEQIVQGKKTQTAGYLKVLISLDKHKIHEDELGQENCSGYHIYLSKTPLSIKSIESNARTKARKRDTGRKFKKLIEKQFYEWYFYEDLVREFKKFPYHFTTNVKGAGVIRDLPPGIYCVGAYGKSSGKTYGVRHNVDFAWYRQVEVRDSEAVRLNLNFSNRKISAIDRNWNLYGGK